MEIIQVGKKGRHLDCLQKCQVSGKSNTINRLLKH
jgi:hypothetical protein